MSAAYYLTTLFNNCIPQRQLVSYSVTRPFLSAKGVACETRLAPFSLCDIQVVTQVLLKIIMISFGSPPPRAWVRGYIIISASTLNTSALLQIAGALQVSHIFAHPLFPHQRLKKNMAGLQTRSEVTIISDEAYCCTRIASLATPRCGTGCGEREYTYLGGIQGGYAGGH